MMAKLVLDDIGNFNSTGLSTINENNSRIEQALENTLSRDGKTPNQMEADLDMNHNDILNVDNLSVEGTFILDGQVVHPENIVVTDSVLWSEVEDTLSGLDSKVPSSGAVKDYVDSQAASVDSIDALRALDQGDIPDVIVVEGYFSGDPRGGGIFVLDPDDDSSADDSGWIIVDALGRRWKRQTSTLLADDFGMSPARTGAQNKAAWDACFAKVTPADGYAIEFIGGTYEVEGGTTVDDYGDFITLPWSGDFGRARRVFLRGRTPTVFKCMSSNTCVLRAGDTNIHLENLHFRKGPATHDNVAIIIGPEDLTQTTTQISTSDFSATNFSIDGFHTAMRFQPGPLGSGAYNARIQNFQITNCMTAIKTAFPADAENNYPTRCGFVNGRIERVMVAADWRVCETFQFFNVETQFCNYKASNFPDETDFPVDDTKGRVFWTSPNTRQCSVDRGRNESAQTDYYVWAEYGTPRSSLFLNTLYNSVSFIGTSDVDPTIGTTSAFPRAIIFDGRGINLAALNDAASRTVIQNEIAPLTLDGKGALEFRVSGAERGRMASIGLLVGATSAPDGAATSGVLVSSPDTTESRWATTVSSSKYAMGFYNSNGKVGGIYTNGSATTFNTTSDERLKTNLREFDPGAIIDALEVWKFDWLTGGSGYGLMAQATYDVFPDAVYQGGDDPKTDPWGLDYAKFVPVLMAELKSLRLRVAELEKLEK